MFLHWPGPLRTDQGRLYLRIRKVFSTMIVMAKKQKRPPTLSEQLKEAILNCGQTRYRIAQETGVTEATLSKFVHGHHGLSLETVDVLGKYLGLRLVVADSATQARKEK